MGDIEDEKGGAQILSRGERSDTRAVNQANKGGASLYQRALAIYNEGSDEWCIPNRGTKAWAKLEAIRDSLTTRSKPKAKRATPRATAKRATAKPSAKRATFKRNVVKSSAKASDAPLREALANLATKRNRVISIPRTIVGRTDEPSMDKQDAGLAKLEAKLDKALTTAVASATDAAALATATATASATDAKLKKLTRKLKTATAATTAAATAVASAPVVATASATTASDSERKLLKLANKLKLATDTAAAATITNNATADAKLSKLVADLRVAQAQAAASASATDAKLFRLTAELERATRAALSTLPQTPERQSALSKVGKLAANITYYTATTVASGVASVAGAVGRKAVEFAASKVAPVPPMTLPTDIQTPTSAIAPDTQRIPEGKQEASPINRPTGDAPPPPIPEREPSSPKRSIEIKTKSSSKRRAKKSKAEPKTEIKRVIMAIPDIGVAISSKSPEASDVEKPTPRNPYIVKLDALLAKIMREYGDTDEMATFAIDSGNTKTEISNIKNRWARDILERENLIKLAGRVVYEQAITDNARFANNAEGVDELITDYGKAGRKLGTLLNQEIVSIKRDREFDLLNPDITSEGDSTAEQTSAEERMASLISTKPPTTRDIFTTTLQSSIINDSEDEPAPAFEQMEGIEVMGQGFREPLTPEEFVINQMRRAVYGN